MIKQGIFTNDKIVLTDAGLETDLIFNRGFELPEFASFPLLDSEKGKRALKEYYRNFLELASEKGFDFLLECPSWRANPNWGQKLGYTDAALDIANAQCVAAMKELKAEYKQKINSIYISGCVGPSGDGYLHKMGMSPEEAFAYHLWQVKILAKNKVDLISALTMTNVAEALGITRAAQQVELPVILSFTVETDGRLPSGESLREAIRTIDEATGSYPAFYMINCAHPSHFIALLETGENWIHRLGGLRANASCKSHAELDNSTELDRGNLEELSDYYVKVQKILPGLQLIGGCCGTDAEHLSRITAKLSPSIVKVD